MDNGLNDGFLNPNIMGLEYMYHVYNHKVSESLSMDWWPSPDMSNSPNETPNTNALPAELQDHPMWAAVRNFPFSKQTTLLCFKLHRKMIKHAVVTLFGMSKSIYIVYIYIYIDIHKPKMSKCPPRFYWNAAVPPKCPSWLWDFPRHSVSSWRAMDCNAFKNGSQLRRSPINHDKSTKMFTIHRFYTAIHCLSLVGYTLKKIRSNRIQVLHLQYSFWRAERHRIFSASNKLSSVMATLKYSPFTYPVSSAYVAPVAR